MCSCIVKLGLATFLLTAALPVSAASVTVSNDGFIDIRDLNSANPYPSTITVAGVQAQVTNVTVELRGLSHTWPADIDILLVGPNGHSVMLMSDVGDQHDLNGVNLVFDDTSAVPVPVAFQIFGGVYRPTNNNGPGTDAMPGPAPSTASATTLAALLGGGPNGTWSLYVYDDAGQDFGNIASGWALTLALASDSTTVVAVFDDAAFVDTANNFEAESDNVQASLANLGFQVATFTDIASAAATHSILLFPEFENGDLSGSLSAQQRGALQNFVAQGGLLIMLGNYQVPEFGDAFLNDTFGFAVFSRVAFGASASLTGDATGTAFEGGPQSLTDNNGTVLLDNFSLPAGTLRIYENGSDTMVAILPFGQGKIIHLGWDWYDAAPAGGQDAGWLDVLARAVGSGEPGDPGGGLEVTLSGVGDGQVLTNGARLHLTAGTSGWQPNQNYQLRIYEGDTMLFGRPFTYETTRLYEVPWTWHDVPLGEHTIRAVLEDENQVALASSSPVTFTVVGNRFGFVAINNLVTIPSPPNTSEDTTVGCQMIVSNQTAALSSPLRIRLFRTQTAYYLNGTGVATNEIVLVEDVPGYLFTTNAIAPGAAFTASLPTSAGVICAPTSQEFDENFQPIIYQNHVYAMLEERIGTHWTIVDRARIFSSLMIIWFPFNEFALDLNPLPNTNLVASLVSLIVTGATYTVSQGLAVPYYAWATLNDGHAGAAPAAWSSVPAGFINSTGLFSAGSAPAGTMVTIRATYDRRMIDETTAVRVVMIEASQLPEITLQPTNQFLAVGGMFSLHVTATGTQPLRYQWLRDGAALPDETNSTYAVSSAQPNHSGSYTVMVSQGSGSVTSSPAIVRVVLPPTMSPPTIQANGSVRFVAHGDPGQACFIDISSDLRTWVGAANRFSDVGTLLIIDTPSPGSRFYRIRLIPEFP